MLSHRQTERSSCNDAGGFRRFGARAGRLLAALLVAAVLVGGPGARTVTASASQTSPGGGPSGWAYLWANEPTSLYYAPDATFQFNSTGASNAVVRAGVGAYTVTLPGLGEAGGIVQVTAFGDINVVRTESCMVASWGPSGSTQQIQVRCFNITTGLPADARFTLTYVKG